MAPAARRSRCSVRNSSYPTCASVRVERRLVVAGVERESGRGRVREGVRGDEVAPARLHRVLADHAGERVDSTLDRVRGFRTAGAAVGVRRRPVREHAGARERVRGDVVEPVVDERAEERDAGRDQLEVRAHVGEQMHPHRGDLAVGIGGELDVLDHAAAVHRRERALPALLGPAHRATEALRHRETERFFRVDVELGPERAADRGYDDPQPVLGDPSDDRHEDLEEVRDLCGRVDRVVAAERLGDHAHPARFHRHRDQALLEVALLHRVRCRRERTIDRVGIRDERPRVRAVGTELGVDEVRIGRGVLEVEHDRELLVVDHDGFGRVLGLPCGLGEHDRDAVADEADLVARERPVIGVFHVFGDGPRARQRRGEVVDQLRARDHVDDAGHRLGARRVDADDLRVRDLAADEAHVRGTGHDDVVDEAGLTSEQRRVLLAQGAPTEDLGAGLGDRGHRGTPPPPAAAAASTALTMLW